ncbi:MAG: hypothetical protein ABSB18_05435 [Candidatus Omnitrophota bacterium]
MKKVSLFLVGFLLIPILVSAAAASPEWEDIGRGNSYFRSVLVYQEDSRIMFAGTNNAILRSEDKGGNWRVVLIVKGADKAVNLLARGFTEKNSLYAATGNGLYKSLDSGKSWIKVFKGRNSLQSQCLAVLDSSFGIFLGTKEGLFYSSDNGRTWQKKRDGIGDNAVLAITGNPKAEGLIYFACSNGAFVTQDKGNSWERIFVAHPPEKNPDLEEKTDDARKEEKLPDIRYIAVDHNNPDCVYLATSIGVYRSSNKGLSWELIPDYGLLNKQVESLAISVSSEVYALSPSGIFVLRKNRWQELSLGLTGRVRQMVLGDQDNLFAACDNGLFRAHIGEWSAVTDRDYLAQYRKNEPAIRQVQEAAIEYAEVNPEKIKRWRMQAAKKALLPQVSLGVDRDTGDLWHWETGSTTRNDDDVLRRGRDTIGWDIRLSWDLGELIWNQDQTSIDVRSKLMAELRGDILDEVTKLYFERIRIKMELNNLSIEERKKRDERQLRLDELAASLDALTGGYFSEALNGRKP